nr:MAG TPA: hypothetical protein [Caudoviricetes sp.]
MLPVLQAFAEGKTIESRCVKGDKSLWYDDEDPSFDDDFEYRIKPEPNYRPFKDAEECWAEMQKHQPVGFMKFKDTESGYYMLTGISRGVGVGINDSLFSYDRVFDDYTFADGLPFGVKVEE